MLKKPKTPPERVQEILKRAGEKQAACTEPCNACPYRRQGMQGWLGEATPEEFMASTMGDYPMPCHQTIDYNDPDWKDDWEAQISEGKLCAGALIFFANICKRSRDSQRPTLPADREKVFASPQEFIDYHNSAEAKSWTFKK